MCERNMYAPHKTCSCASCTALRDGLPVRDIPAVEPHKPVCYMVTCEDGHVGYFPSVYTTLCDVSSKPLTFDKDGEPEDRCLKERTAVPLYTESPPRESDLQKKMRGWRPEDLADGIPDPGPPRDESGMRGAEEDERTELVMALTMKVTVLRAALEKIGARDVVSPRDDQTVQGCLERHIENVRWIARAALTPGDTDG